MRFPDDCRLSLPERDLERQIDDVKFKLMIAQTAFYRRLCLSELDLLESRRSAAARAWLARHRRIDAVA
jgi:hypothetical protein